MRARRIHIARVRVNNVRVGYAPLGAHYALYMALAPRIGLRTIAVFCENVAVFCGYSQIVAKRPHFFFAFFCEYRPSETSLFFADMAFPVRFSPSAVANFGDYSQFSANPGRLRKFAKDFSWNRTCDFANWNCRRRRPAMFETAQKGRRDGFREFPRIPKFSRSPEHCASHEGVRHECLRHSPRNVRNPTRV